jgi:hypothetical protein
MNRLNELKGDDADVEKGDESGSEKASGSAADDNAATGGGEEQEQFMTEFFEEVGQIKAWMSSIRKNISAIEEVYGQFITAVTGDQTKGELRMGNQSDVCVCESVRECVTDLVRSHKHKNHFFPFSQRRRVNSTR